MPTNKIFRDCSCSVEPKTEHLSFLYCLKFTCIFFSFLHSIPKIIPLQSSEEILTIAPFYSARPAR